MSVDAWYELLLKIYRNPEGYPAKDLLVAVRNAPWPDALSYNEFLTLVGNLFEAGKPNLLRSLPPFMGKVKVTELSDSGFCLRLKNSNVDSGSYDDYVWNRPKKVNKDDF